MRQSVSWMGGWVAVLVCACSSPDGSPDPAAGGACGTCAPDSACQLSASGSACVPLSEEGKAGEPLFFGRHARLANGDVRFGFPGTGMAIRFEGTGLGVALQDRAGRAFQNHLRVRIDDRPPFTLTLDRDQGFYALASDLPPGVHDVRITKLTEGFVGAVDFRALDVGAGTLLAPRVHARRILFVGDSTTSAFGILGKGPSCPYVPAEQDVELAYATLTARELRAEPLLVARSGVGFFQNFDGTRTDVAMDLLSRAVPFEAAGWELASDRPDAVVLFLGDNDFAHEVPQEADFVPAVAKVVSHLRTAFPRIPFVFVLTPLTTDEFPVGAQQRTKLRAYVQQALATSGAANVVLLELPQYDPSDEWGCEWHPSPAANRRMATAVTERLRTLLGW